MESIARAIFNKGYTDKRYADFLQDITNQFNHTPQFRIAETPIFIDLALKAKIFEACELINDTVTKPNFKELTQGAIKPEFHVPNETPHSIFLQYDFGICEENGELVPKLIEAQGFPTLYFYQNLIAGKYREHFDIPDNYAHLAKGMTVDEYKAMLDRVIVAGHKPENVVLLEVEPDAQPTRIDFLCTSKDLGIKTLCVSDLKKDGRNLYYLDENKRKIEVNRIYNRVIFDELLGRKDLIREYHFSDDVDVEWAGHPHWFFRISKYTLPLFQNKYVPRTYFLDQLEKIPADLENFVLKPLYSFSGSGVIFDVKPEHFDAIQDRSNYILQEKVKYSPVVQALDDKVKCEIRMLMIWEPGTARPRIVNNLARLSRGAMIGVKFNRDKTWVGGSVAFFEQE
jgi:hypothetical protein